MSTYLVWRIIGGKVKQSSGTKLVDNRQVYRYDKASSMKRVFSLVVVVLFIFFSAHTVHAQDASQSASPSAVAQVSYDLAYPGLLPDHPLYFFKVIRDKVVSSLINDPIKRAEFNLLTSDKRFNAALSLIDKGKDEKAIDTLSKSNNYFHDSIVSLEKAKSMDRDMTALRDREREALSKRFEITKGLEKEISADYKKGLQEEVKRLKKLEDRLNDL